MNKYTAEYYRQEWRCGDGCCSDSWVNLDLLKNGKVYMLKEEIRCIFSPEEAEEFARDLIDDENYELEITGGWEY
jgi:hypothetical protein